jgi:hypothetical protein
VPEETGIVKKEARQGEFDNIHIAPRLKLMNVPFVVPRSAPYPERGGYDIEDRPRWGLDDIAMAPFCAHDCFHMHWRWATFAEARSSLGWGASGPYEVAGAPLVPPEQDVWLWFRARAAITYHVVASQPRFLCNWHVLMHHGFGYAVSIAEARKFWVAMQALQAFSDVGFMAENGEPVGAANSTAAYYWMARHGITFKDGVVTPRERLTWATDADLNAAMDL